MKVVYMFKGYEDDDGKIYDAYVSMSKTPEVEHFVYYMLRPRLEERGFKLYLELRDGQVGGARSDAILDALEQSRRTIMIVNPDYVKNEWNRFEVLTAQHETLKLNQRIIPIILQDLPEEEKKKDKTLKNILENIKCLRYPEKKLDDLNKDSDMEKELPGGKKFQKKEQKFWKRLELTMPKKRDPEVKNLSQFDKMKMFWKSGGFKSQAKTSKYGSVISESEQEPMQDKKNLENIFYSSTTQDLQLNKDQENTADDLENILLNNVTDPTTMKNKENNDCMTENETK